MTLSGSTSLGRIRMALLALAALGTTGVVTLAFTQSATAQTPAAGGTPPTKGRVVGSTPSGGKPAAKSAPDGAEASRADGNSQLRQRIDQLEEQINEMHVSVGTLESFAKTGAARATSSPPSPASGANVGGDTGVRLDGMENRLRSLTSQIEQLAQQVRALEARGGRPTQERGDVVPPAGTRTADARIPDEPIAGVARGAGPSAGGQPSGDAIAGLIRGPGNDRDADVGSATLPPIGVGQPAQPRQQPASLTTGTGNPREIYDRAYGSLLRQDYPGAEIGFAEFITQFPNHELSGNAQYWLGESFYVRGQYKPAANAFLKGYQTYPKSQKGPDSLLKLGMSLDKLGQRAAACSSIGELSTRFPSAPAHIQTRAQSERARLGC